MCWLPVTPHGQQPQQQPTGQQRGLPEAVRGTVLSYKVLAAAQQSTAPHPAHRLVLPVPQLLQQHNTPPGLEGQRETQVNCTWCEATSRERCDCLQGLQAWQGCSHRQQSWCDLHEGRQRQHHLQASPAWAAPAMTWRCATWRCAAAECRGAPSSQNGFGLPLIQQDALRASDSWEPTRRAASAGSCSRV